MKDWIIKINLNKNKEIRGMKKKNTINILDKWIKYLQLYVINKIK